MGVRTSLPAAEPYRSQKRPATPDISGSKAWALGILGRKAEALQAVNRALELDPGYFDAVKRKKRLEVM